MQGRRKFQISDLRLQIGETATAKNKTKCEGKCTSLTPEGDSGTTLVPGAQRHSGLRRTWSVSSRNYRTVKLLGLVKSGHEREDAGHGY